MRKTRHLPVGVALALALTGAALATGCGSANAGSTGFGGGGGAGGGGGSGPGGFGGGPLLDAGTPDGSGSVPSCSEAAKLVYLVSETYDFLSFDPGSLAFAKVGSLACPNTNGATPFSMAIQRNGTAWVLYSDGRIFHVDVTNAACSPTTFAPGQHGFTTFGMGFVSDAAGSDAETLYVSKYTTTRSTLAKIDTQTLALTVVGDYDALEGTPEMTGTGDARLYGFFSSAPVTIAEIDRSNAHIMSQAPQPSVSIGGGWAFAFWGGTFWMFTAPGLGTQVDNYDPATQQTKTVVPGGSGITIVGAGVSTCAPTTPPG